MEMAGSRLEESDGEAVVPFLVLLLLPLARNFEKRKLRSLLFQLSFWEMRVAHVSTLIQHPESQVPLSHKNHQKAHSKTSSKKIPWPLVLNFYSKFYSPQKWNLSAPWANHMSSAGPWILPLMDPFIIFIQQSVMLDPFINAGTIHQKSSVHIAIQNCDKASKK